MKSSCFTWVFIILAAVFGLALGLLVGWVVWPVEWINASPENLRFEFQTNYLESAIDSYQVNQNNELAQERYQWLGSKGPEVLAAVQENPIWVTQQDIDDYVTAISSPVSGAAPMPTPAPVSTIERLKPLVWWIMLVVLLALAAIVLLAIVIIRMLRSRKLEPEAQPTEPPAELVEPAPAEETHGVVEGTAAVAAVELAEQEPALPDEWVRGEEAPMTVEEEGEGGIGGAGLAAAALVGAALAGGDDEEKVGEALAVEEIEAPASEEIVEAAPAAEESEAGGIGVAGLAAAALVGAAVAGGEAEEEPEVAPEVEVEGQPAELLPAAVGAEELGWALEEKVPEIPVEAAPEGGLAVSPAGEWVGEQTGAETRSLEPPETYGKYNLKVIDIEGIGPVYAARLEQLGISTTHSLLQQCATLKGRQQLADVSGISHTLILEWANHADMMRVRGIGPQWSDLLEMAGVNTVREMAMRNPANLHQKLVEINEEKKLVRQLPTQAQVEDWVEQAKELPAILMY